MRKLIWVFCVLGVWAACSAVAGAVGGVGDDPCMSELEDMSDCIAYVTNGSKVNKPPPECCKEVKPVLEQHAVCLCVILTGADVYGIAINVTRAIGLPPACGLAPFNTSICQSPSPGPTPGPSPAPSPPAPAPAPAPAPVPPSPTAPAPSPSEASSAGMLSVSVVVALLTFAVAVGSNV